MEFFEKLISDSELQKSSLLRKKNEIEVRVNNEDISIYEKDGWDIKKQYRNGSSIIVKRKNNQHGFIDDLWSIFYKMGFTVLNSEKICADLDNGYIKLEKTIDIIAIDDETCLFIDCYSAEKLNRVKEFGEEIDNINKTFKILCNIIRDRFGDKKCKYIIATKNYIINQTDLENMAEYKISYFNEENINYYRALVNHIGSAARYQLLGNLFSKTVIKGMDERVPAIEGKMGNLLYYSFLIEPERLLKIGYVLHRNKANHNQMPTYQRLIKKERLKSIRSYVDSGGFFPNSLIISIDSKFGKLKFEKSANNLQGSHSRLGTLFLPKEYQTAYIIDGQHRLYGYSDSRFASTDTVPVIAFVDLDKEKQVKMFMDINENQKPVSKTLRNILNIDLNWNSEILSKRREAVILSVCQSLGENQNSPLFGRVITGEDSINETRCITIEYLKSAIDKTNLFNKYNKKNEILEKGLLDKIDSEVTFQNVYAYLRNCLQVIEDLCKDEWEKGSNGYITINNTIVGIIRVIADITNITIKNNLLNERDLDINQLFELSAEQLISFAETLNNLSIDKRNEIKSSKGGAAKDFSWRTLQVAMNANDSTFTNNELEKYIDENCTNYNDIGLNELIEIKESIISKLYDKITNKIDWEQLFIPEDLYIKLNQKVIAHNIKSKRNGNEEDSTIWKEMEIDDICKILNYKSNWSTIIKDIFMNYNKTFTRQEISLELKNLQLIEQKIGNGKQITKSEFMRIDSFKNNMKGVESWNQY